MKLSISTGTLYVYPLRTVLRWAREAGFDGVELVVNPEVIVRGGAGTRRLAEAEGVPILSLHPTVILLPGWHERHGGADATIALAREMGAGVVVMHTPRSETLGTGEGLAFCRRVERWQPRLEGSSLRLAVENKAVGSPEDLGYALTDLERLRAFADRYDLGVVLDTTHAGSAGDDLLYARRLFDGRLANVHLSDRGALAVDLPRVGSAFANHRYPGAGTLPLTDLLADLAAGGYGGPVTLEVNPFALRFWWPPAIRRRLAQAVAWMRDAIADPGGQSS